MQNEPAYFNELLPIPTILSGIRAHYWESPLPDSLKQAQAGALTLHELREVRRGLLQVVGVFLKAVATQQNALCSDDIQVSALHSVAHMHMAAQNGCTWDVFCPGCIQHSAIISLHGCR